MKRDISYQGEVKQVEPLIPGKRFKLAFSVSCYSPYSVSLCGETVSNRWHARHELQASAHHSTAQHSTAPHRRAGAEQGRAEQNTPAEHKTLPGPGRKEGHNGRCRRQLCLYGPLASLALALLLAPTPLQVRSVPSPALLLAGARRLAQ